MNRKRAVVLPFRQLMSYHKMIYVEFREFPSANTHLTIGNALMWVDRVFRWYEIKNSKYGINYRFWTKEPSEREREAAAWEV